MRLRSKKYYCNFIEYDCNLYIPFLGLAPMTKTKTMLGISLAAVFAVSMIGTAFAGAHPAWITPTDFSIDQNLECSIG